MFIPTLANMLHYKLRFVGEPFLYAISRNAKRSVYDDCNKLKNARDKQLRKIVKDVPKFKVGHLVLLKNQKTQSLGCKIYFTFLHL